jgi:hypothetical protein
VRPTTFLEREKKDRSLPIGVFVKVKPRRGGLRVRYQLRIRSKADAAAARRCGVPVRLLEPSAIAQLGYPVDFAPRLLVSASVAGALVESAFPIVIEHEDDAVLNPTVEDTLVSLLRVSMVGARRIALRHRSSLDVARLRRRIVAEGMERRAYTVRLDDIVPGLLAPAGVKALSRAALRFGDQVEF